MRGSPALLVSGPASAVPFPHATGLRQVLDLAAGAGVRSYAGFAKFRETASAARIDSIRAGLGLRRDAADVASGMHTARQLEHIYKEVLREPHPVQNAFELFPVDTSVPPGARTHTARRIYQSGEVDVYRAGQPTPRVGISQQEESFQVKHYVTSWATDLFSRQSSDFAGTSEIQELARVGRDVVNEFANRMTWYGSDEYGIHGVLNYPWLAKKVVATPFTSASSAEDILAELQALDNYAQETSNSTMRPNACVMSPRARNLIFNRRLSDASDTTIGEFFLRNSANIKSIEEAWELQGVGPGGTDGVLFYRRDRLGISNVIPQGFTPLPVQSFGFEDITHAFMSHGGVIMRDVGNNTLGWVDAG